MTPNHHPGVVAIFGSQSILAALPAPLDTRSPAREANPQPCLPGCPIRNPGFVARDGFLPGREPSGHVCSTRRDRTFIREGSVVRALNFSTSRLQLAGDAARDGAKSLHSVSDRRSADGQ